MTNTKRIIIATVAVVAVVAGAVIYTLLAANKTSAPEASTDHKTPDTGSVASVITYDGSAFKVSKDTVTSGSTVKVANDSSQPLSFDSDPHPVHTDNPELNEGDISPGQSKTFVLEKKGTWGFHNHLDASQRGKITVK